MNDLQRDYIDGLRSMAAWFELHPDLIPLQSVAHAMKFEYDDGDITAVKKLSEAARIMGRADKNGDSLYFYVTKHFGPHKFSVIAPRDSVCKKIVVGTEHVPEQVIAEYEREIVEWECAPSLLAATT